MNKQFIFSIVFIATTAIANAQNKDSLKTTWLSEVVVSDTKFALSKEKSGKIIEVISEKELSTKKGLSLATVLSQVAGVEMNGNQSFSGKNIGYYIRGGRNRQTAIYIDGVPVSDASGINLEYDLRLISVEQIEKIEIMKGASSTLYGSGAATGVINITLKKAPKKPFSGNAYLHLNTQNTATKQTYYAQDFNQGLSLNGTQKRFSYLTSINSTESKGLSEAAGDSFEKDNFSRVNIIQKIGYKATNQFQFDVFGHYDRIKNNFDNSFNGISSNSDDLNNKSFSEQFRLGFLPKFTHSKGEIVLNAAVSKINRTVHQSNSWTGKIDSYAYEGNSASFDLFSKYKLSNALFFIVGTQFQYLAMEQDKVSKEQAKFSLFDPYSALVFNSDFGFNLNAGFRLNTHSEYGNHWVYNINPSFSFSKIPLKIITSYSTAFITPSLYQLYGPYGNLLLTPEQNATAEVGFEYQIIPEKIQFSAVGFYRNEKNTIGFYYNPVTSASNYRNVTEKNNAKGVETTLKYNLSDHFSISGNYTFTEVETALNRLIPKHKGNLAFQFFSKKTQANLDYQFVSKRNDAYYDSASFVTKQVELKAYQILNTNFTITIIPNRLQVLTAITNITNTDFQEVIGYSTRGRNYKLGLQFSF